ncbi:MAG TPA: c-type cytochrome [Candidatus Cybelea sp.]|nr:c-type cytochrome [Candidatus Cybelea sp.]
MKMGERPVGTFVAVRVVVVVVAGLLYTLRSPLARTPQANNADSDTRFRSTAGQQSSSAQGSSAAKVTTAGDAYMNIQVLKDIPSDQLLPAMRYITAALGVQCDFCHVPKNFESDDKAEKTTARKMMQMMFAINKDNFNGRREVTCYTCHRGLAHAANLPVLTATGMAPAMGAAPASSASWAPTTSANSTPAGAAVPKITVDEIVAKYTEQIGGAAAIQKLTTLDEQGTIELPLGGGMKAEAEEVRKAPNKVVTVVHLPNGTAFAEGYNGTSGWQQEPGHGADDLEGDDLVRAKYGAAFIPGLDLKEDFSRVQVAAVDKVGDQDAYRVIAFRKGGGQMRFYFDSQSGLLLRVSERIESPLGDLPQDTDYSDYRDVHGAKLPFTVTETLVDGRTTLHWDRIQVNLPIEDARFDKPVQKAGAAQP